MAINFPARFENQQAEFNASRAAEAASSKLQVTVCHPMDISNLFALLLASDSTSHSDSQSLICCRSRSWTPEKHDRGA